MKTKVWLVLIGIAFVLCLGLSLPLLLPGQTATHVVIRSQGKILHTLPLHVDTQIQISTDRGTNTVTVRDGKAAVTQADCPDGHCMDRGFCSGGVQIVCLPNRLVLEFEGQQTVDAVVG